MKMFKDMDTEQYWLTLWTFVITGVVIIACIIGYTSYHEDKLVARLIKDGHDPLELSCVYNLSSYNETACLILAQNKVKKEEK